MSGHPYDDTCEPAAPRVPLRVAAPSSGAAIVLAALVDTGADGTFIPERVATQLGLPLVDHLTVEGVAGGRAPARVYAATVELGPLRTLCRLVAFEDEAILGRDLLNRLVVLLDGPRLEASLRKPSARKRRGGR